MAIRVNGTEVIDDNRNVTNVVLVDGRNVSSDGTKLDNISSNADVTSAALPAALTGLSTIASPASSDLVAIYDGSGSTWGTATITAAALQGTKGQKGEVGATGLTGTTGAKGQKGEVGQKGQTGSQGIQGIQGIQGATGATGSAGTNGSTGAKGQKGEVGQKGQTGSQGIQGIQGAKGQKGEVGQKGQTGNTGSQGIQGVAGNTGSQGIQGAKGQKGQPGTNGTNGSTGAKGQKGEVGQKGQKGQQGIQGIQGIQGGTGGTGAKGQKGQTGGGGSTGAKGQKGQTGNTGSQGIQGAKGQKGEVGQKGQKGQTGSGGGTGSTGAKGQKGEPAATGAFLATAGGTMTGNTLVSNYGIGNVGVYSATRYQAVWSMGNAYKQDANGTGLSNLYGISYTHTNVGGQSKSGLSHQALFVENGVTKSAIGTGIWTSGVITTTNNIVVSGTVDGRNVSTDGTKLDTIATGATANVGDITGVTAGTNMTGGGTSGTPTLSTIMTPTFNDVYCNSWFRSYTSGRGMYNQSTLQHFYSDHNDFWNVAGGVGANGIRFRDTYAGTVRGAVYADVNNKIGLLDKDHQWCLRHTDMYSTEFLSNNVVKATINNAGNITATSFTGDGSNLTGVGGSTTLGAVGTYAFLGRNSAASITSGTSYAGSILKYAGSQSTNAYSDNTAMDVNSGSAPSGTWRAMGNASTVTYRVSATLFIRIS
jgi:hypothetical protein